MKITRKQWKEEHERDGDYGHDDISVDGCPFCYERDLRTKGNEDTTVEITHSLERKER